MHLSVVNNCCCAIAFCVVSPVFVLISSSLVCVCVYSRLVNRHCALLNARTCDVLVYLLSSIDLLALLCCVIRCSNSAKIPRIRWCDVRTEQSFDRMICCVVPYNATFSLSTMHSHNVILAQHVFFSRYFLYARNLFVYFTHFYSILYVKMLLFVYILNVFNCF